MRRILKKTLGHEIIEVFSNSYFLYFILSVVFSQIAMNLMTIALIFLVFIITSSNLSVALVILTFIIPQVFLSFIGGIVADFKNKQQILVYGNLSRAFCIFFLFFWHNSVVAIYIVGLLVSIVTQFYIPAETPLIPKLVKKEHLTAANSIFGIALFGSILIGYILAGPALSIFGRANVFILISFLFVVASFCVKFVPHRLVRSATGKTITNPFDSLKDLLRHEFRKTYSLLSGTKEVLDAFFLLASSQIIVWIIASIVPGYAKSILEIPVEDLSLLLFSPAAIGMIISSLLVGGKLHGVDREKLMNTGLLISGIVFLLFPFTSRIVSRGFVIFINAILPKFLSITEIHLTILISFLAGFANALIFVPSQTIIQDRIPEVFRSKIYGLLFSLIGIFSLLPIILTGWVADAFGIGTVLFIIGFLIILVAFSRLRLFTFKIGG